MKGVQEEEYDRAVLSHEERRAINDARRTRRQATTIPPLVDSIELRNCDGHRITDKIKEFYTKLYTIEPHECSIC